MQWLAFVGWLRVFLITLVVAHHAGQPYGATGGEWPVDDPANTDWLGPFFALNAAYFMGFFFLIAGYFTGGSYDRKGAAAFVRDRLIRLGIPLLFFGFVFFPALLFFRDGGQAGFFSYYFGDYIGRWNIELGHLWFVAQLLAYGLLYVLWRTWRKQGEGASPAPGNGGVLIYALALGLVGALVRLAYPQDAWVNIVWLIPAEPAHLPQYVSLFVVGVVAGRGDWFRTIPARLGMVWFPVGLVAYVGMLAAYVVQDRLPSWLPFQSVWGFFEAFVCVGMILGLTVLFRRYCNRPGVWLDRLDGNVYGVYLGHWPVVVAIQAAILGLALSATAKFFIVTVVALAISFALSALLRTIPAVRRVV